MSNKIIEFHLDQSFCFYSNTGRLYINSLLKILNEVNKKEDLIETVLILDHNSTQDYNKEWLDSIDSKMLLTDLHQNLILFRQLLREIAKSQTNWVFATNGDIIDSHFELAMACHHVIVLNSNARVGMDCLFVGIHSPGGFLEKEYQIKKSRYESWFKNPILKASEAKSLGYIKVLCNSDDWLHHARIWCRSLSKRVIINKVIKSKDSQSISYSEEKQKWIEAKFIHDKDTDFTKNLKLLIDHKSWFRNELSWEYTLCYLYAKCLLGKNYKFWLQCKLMQQRGIDYGENTIIQKLPVYINLNHLSPPTKVLISFFQANIPVVFFASSGTELQNHLERLFLKFEKDIETGDLNKYWDQFVCWKVDERNSTSREMIWGFCDNLEIKKQNITEKYFRLEGNLYSAKLGICEKIVKDFFQDDEVQTLSQSFATGKVVKSKGIGSNHLPVYIWIRSILLNELLRMSNFHKKNINEIFKILKNRGWGFVANEDRWNRFIQIRYSTWSTIEKSHPFFQQYKDVISNWNANSWKEAALNTNRDISPIVGHIETQMEIHLFILSGILAHVIFKNELVASLNDASLLCAEAIGTPSKESCPLTFLKYYGIKRVSKYVHLNWNEFKHLCVDL